MPSTSIVSALALDVPIVVGVNSQRDDSQLGPFLAWPLCLHELLQPTLRDNPYRDALRIVEILQQDDFIASCRALLFDEEAIAAQRERQRAYRTIIAELPRAPQLLDAFLDEKT